MIWQYGNYKFDCNLKPPTFHKFSEWKKNFFKLPNVDKLEQTLDKQKSLEKELKQLKAQLASAQSGDMLADAVDVNGIKVLAVKVSETDAKRREIRADIQVIFLLLAL